MKLPISWLKELVKTDLTSVQISEKLLSCGFEVEEIINRGKEIDRIVAGKIESIIKHPNADKLSICSVNTGAETLQIVTGAKNVSTGDIVPVALDGSTVFGGKKIFKGELRGVRSDGMLCSGEELGITDADYEGASVDGILILKPDVKIGSGMAQVLCLDEDVLDISVTANRPDCQSIIGLAREVAAITGSKLKPVNMKYKESAEKMDSFLSVEVQDASLCPRYMGRVVKDIVIKESPEWMKKRLRLCGLRPINSIVDITNYVLLEMGHPMHSFDQRLISGGKIVVRRAHQGEVITTLNDQKNVLDDSVLVICDDKTPVAIAGVMGGKDSGIKPDTATVIFEAAKFARDSIRKTSKKLNLKSDASSRFEKGIDSESCRLAMDRALSLIDELKCGTILSGAADEYESPTPDRVITADVREIDSLLGIEIDRQKILSILNNLQIESALKGNTLTCKIPAFREDIEDYPDIAEEIIRTYGYDHIESTLLKNASVTRGGRSEHHRNMDRLKQLAEAEGFFEIITFSFVQENALKMLKAETDTDKVQKVVIANPLSEKTAVMRTSLAHSMLETAALSCKRKVLSGRLFELGKVYLPKSADKEELPNERETLCLAAFGEDEDFFTLKGSVEKILQAYGVNFTLRRSNMPYLHAGRSADIVCGGNIIGCFGEVNPDVLEEYDIRQRVYLAEMDIELFSAQIKLYDGFKDIPKYPGIERDLALIVNDEVTCGELTQCIEHAGGMFLKEVRLFDQYKGGQIAPGEKSLAFTLLFRDDNATLKSQDADKAVENILQKLKHEYNARLR